MPQLDFSTYLPQVFWLVVTFIALFLIMWKIAVPRIANSLEARQKRIEDFLDRAADAKKEAEETLAAYELAMKEARAEAHDIIGQASKKIAEQAEAREAELTEALNRKFAESEADIQQAIDGAMDNVRDIAVDVAAEALGRLTGEKPDDKNLAKAVDAAMKAEG
ncbi:MAG TPA: F0F1 ATP synthase subunit B' [Rhodospirillales bacterium]|jgi:F-type H+-transporting ATPase subunit b|nr:F0F1 ATP synthase subunit B' [Rhodospirillales bacterium]